MAEEQRIRFGREATAVDGTDPEVVNSRYRVPEFSCLRVTDDSWTPQASATLEDEEDGGYVVATEVFGQNETVSFTCNLTEECPVQRLCPGDRIRVKAEFIPGSEEDRIYLVQDPAPYQSFAEGKLRKQNITMTWHPKRDLNETNSERPIID